MKSAIGVLIGMFISTLCQAEITEHFALIKDSEGYVNVRQSDDMQSKIIKTLSNNTVVSAYCEAEVSNNNFCFIFTSDEQTGYVYKNRLSFFENNHNFIYVPFIADDNPLMARFSDSFNNTSATITLKPTVIKASQIRTFDPYIKNCPVEYKGECSYGINGTRSSPDEKQYRFDSISIALDNKIINIPQKLLKNLYTPKYLVETNQAFNDTAVYINPTDNHLYLMSTQGGVTGIYTVVYEIIDAKYVKKYVWSEDL